MASISISVVMPAYNSHRWIAEAVESVLQQTSPPDELIVVDDGSTDETIDQLKPYLREVRLICQPNTGAANAYNRGFREARSTYVAICPSDDVWNERKLEWQREILAAMPDIDVLFGGARYFGLSDRMFPRPAKTGLQETASFIDQMYIKNRIPHPSTVVRRAFHLELGGYVVGTIAEDYEFWLRALRRGAIFYYDPLQVVQLRLHGANVSDQALSMWKANYRIHKAYATAVANGIARRVLASDLRRIARCYLGLSQVEPARKAYRESLQQFPTAAALAGAGLLSLPGSATAVQILRRVRDRLVRQVVV